MAKGKGFALIAVAGIAALAAGSAGASTGPRPLPPPPPRPTPKPGPDENEGVVPAEIIGRVMTALASQNPATMRAEAKRLRAEGWTLQAKDLDDAANEIEARTKPPGPTPPPPAPPAPSPVAVRDLVRGMKGDDVKRWQQQLQSDGYTNIERDGNFGDLTFAATAEWQWERELDDDGIVGAKTRAAIGTRPKRQRPPAPGPAPAPAPLPLPAPAPAGYPAEPKEVPPTLRGVTLKLDPHERFDARVELWQSRLQVLGARPKTDRNDGRFGPKTQRETTAAQGVLKLTANGIADPRTIEAAYRWKPAASSSAPAPVKPPAPAPVKPPTQTAPPVNPPPPPTSNPSASPAVPALLANVTLRRQPSPEPFDERVVTWQNQLMATGARPKGLKSDGKFGRNVEAQTKEFQRLKGLAQTGVADPTTIAAAYGVKPKAATPAAPKPTEPTPAVPPLVVNISTWRSNMEEGNKGDDVREWQRVLARYGYDIDDDGDFGKLTTTATKAWQEQYKRFNDVNRAPLNPDGEVGKNTRERLAELERGKSIVAGDLERLPTDFRDRMMPMLTATTPQILGVEIDRHLRVTPPGMEDRELIATFQRAHGLNDTGVYGAATAEALIPLGIIPPDPREWPSKKLWRTKNRYKLALREAARRDPEREDEWLRAAGRV